MTISKVIIKCHPWSYTKIDKHRQKEKKVLSFFLLFLSCTVGKSICNIVYDTWDKKKMDCLPEH